MKLQHSMFKQFHVFTSPEMPNLYAIDPDREAALEKAKAMAEKLQADSVRALLRERIYPRAPHARAK
ncbi:MAG: hypothetical protein JWN93_1220 [Hyphomicrobiales bacterium]|nr:hypothetical protein [Hyphomicrobiales bacterium]